MVLMTGFRTGQSHLPGEAACFFPLSFPGRQETGDRRHLFPLSLLGRERVAEGRERVVKKSGACRR
jgi:hypothetical protein